MNEQLHPLFRNIVNTQAPLTQQDKQDALSLAMDAGKPMHTWLRFRIIGQYGTAEDLANFARSLAN